MKTYTLNKNSWHYRLITKYARVGEWHLRNEDFCSYFWMVLFSAIWTSLLTAAVGLTISGVVSYGIIWWVHFTMGGSLEIMFDDWITILGILIIIFAVMICAIYIVFTLTAFLIKSCCLKGDEAEQWKEKFESSFLYLWYKKSTEKICFRINFKD